MGIGLMSRTISQARFEKLEEVVGEKATILFCALVRLFTCGPNDKSWIYSELAGGLCLVIDRSLGGICLLKLFDLNWNDLLMDFELYEDLHNYIKDANDSFFYFPIKGGMMGFSFANSNDSEHMKEVIQQYGPRTDEDNFQRQRMARSANLARKDSDITILSISKPFNFKHEAHIGRDYLDVDNLPKEFKRIIKNAGLTKKELKDEKMRNLVLDMLVRPVVNTPSKVKNQPGEKSKKKEEAKVDGKDTGNKKQDGNGAPPPPPLILPPPAPKLPQPTQAKTIIPESVFKKIDRSAMLDQITKGNFVLKKAEPVKEKIKIDDQTELQMTGTLARAIAERRKELTKNEQPDDDDDPGQWSD
eukprot:TRINITY_DN1162_c0_g1_i1.p1 TRINITY_DN1162_c0_g1~~TRINITY_DN1162_c0_g1_i1.p1  ORF type:complete len:389 (-),score=109.50 TRINITY_DN1162_c0_g1_i1:109-1185(-)